MGLATIGAAAGETIEEVELAMNNDLLRIKEWLLANELSLNVAKTEFLLIGSHHKLNNLDFNHVLTSVMTVLNKCNIVEFSALKLTKIYPGLNTLKM